MTSAVDTTKPTSGSAQTADVRSNFSIISNEISALQNGSGLTGLADTSTTTLGDYLVGVKRTATGATATNLHNWIEGQVLNVKTDFGAVGDGVIDDTASFLAALAAADAIDGTVFVPNPAIGQGYKITAQLDIPANVAVVGENKYSTRLIKAFNGYFGTLAGGSQLHNLYIDGQGATRTGRGFFIGAGNGYQLVRSCKIIDFADYCIYFNTEAAGSRFYCEDCELYQYDGTTSGQEAVCIAGSLTVTGNPRTFVGIQTLGKRFIDTGACNNLFITASRVGDILFNANSRGVLISCSRLAGTSGMTVLGKTIAIVGCDIAPAVTIGSGSQGVTLRGNTYNQLPIVDSANDSTNELELTGIVDRFSYRVEAGGTFMAFADADMTPSVAGRTCWQVSNTGSTSITNFDDGFNGQVIIVRMNSNTGITHNNSNIRLANSISIPVGFYGSNDMICFERISGIWFEQWRTPSAIIRSATYDPPNLADGAGTTTTVTCVGAALGDVAEASFSLDLQGITVTAYVSAADTVSVRFQNESGGALDLASGTLRVKVTKAV